MCNPASGYYQSQSNVKPAILVLNSEDGEGPTLYFRIPVHLTESEVLRLAAQCIEQANKEELDSGDFTCEGGLSVQERVEQLMAQKYIPTISPEEVVVGPCWDKLY